ncbi:MAG TPA: isoprenylcysteine carboxylmethyltransferase family protein [Anaerolineales bacterium]|nr:isoprenylcysteine carboxylmethyltransferase family protein [Anaerolineales bacterium]
MATDQDRSLAVRSCWIEVALLFMALFFMISGFALWGLSHSLLASLAWKDFFRKMFGDGVRRVYRLGFNIFSVLTLLPVLWLMWIPPSPVLYLVPAPWKYLMLVGQAIAAFLLLYGVLQTDILSFIGLRQLFDAEDRTHAFVTNGLYRFVRHPLYGAGLLFLWLTPTMTINRLTVYGCATIYILIGAHFEERKLLREFGTAYAEYKALTPMIIPGLLFNRGR